MKYQGHGGGVVRFRLFCDSAAKRTKTRRKGTKRKTKHKQ
jgi:hypothetical protein